MRLNLITLLLIGVMHTYAQDKIKVVSSASIFQDMARAIGGDRVETYSIVPIGGDPHTYSPSPSDVDLVASADIVLINGLTFEGWITELIENSGTEAEVILITEGVEPITSIKYDNASDPHAWMNAANGLIYAQNIATALQNRDPLYLDHYETRLRSYLQELRDMDRYIKEQISTIPPEKRILITSHDAFQYYGRAYGIQLNAVMGISTESKAQTKDVQRIIDAIRENEVPAIFIESTINPKMLQQIAKDYNVNIGGELYSDSIGDEESDAPTYLAMLKHNTDIIVNALTGKSIAKTKIDEDSSSIWSYVLLSIALLAALILFAAKMIK